MASGATFLPSYPDDIRWCQRLFYCIDEGMRYFFLLLLTLGTACAPQKFTGGNATDLLRPYVEDFVSLYGSEFQLAYFIAPLENRYAQCQKASGIITVDEDRWDGLCEAQKRAVVFHELGHCVLNRDHIEERSYMFPNLRSCEFYQNNQDELDEELFSST